MYNIIPTQHQAPEQLLVLAFHIELVVKSSRLGLKTHSGPWLSDCSLVPRLSPLKILGLRL